MKKILLYSLLSFTFYFVSAQATWTWVQGDIFMPGYGVYGIKGVADASNKPAVRSGQSIWQDATGNIWMFGGYGISANGTGYLNDLWKYTPSTDTWTWVNGDNIQDNVGNYGTKGVASVSNSIPSRANAVSWTDASGNFWIFGGKGNNVLYDLNLTRYDNDLWMYSPSTNIWTWMGGFMYYSTYFYGVYGTKGVAATSNEPGSRYGATSWTDAAGDLWMYGGSGLYRPPGFMNDVLGIKNDLWRYSLSSHLWTWVSGDTTIDQAGSYGTKGISSTVNKPGSKLNATGWADVSGKLWLFGGGYSGKYLNDLWMYTPSSNMWTWINGDSTADRPGVYETKNVSTFTNRPGARFGSMKWTDNSGNLLLYGGTNSSGSFNDLWKYTPSSGQWTWLNGDTIAGTRPATYGPKGTLTDTTKPPTGILGGAWTDNANNLWLSETDILWKYSLTANQWSWVRGDTSSTSSAIIYHPGVYGTAGTASATNKPGDRKFGTTWTDASNNLWMYGGLGYSSTLSSGTGYFSDMWKYTPSTNQWTWMNGDSVYNKSPSYGTQNTASGSNTPGARSNASGWTDAAGNLWLFGGVLYPGSPGTTLMGDLWKFSTSTGQWTWINGGQGIYGVYNTKGITSAASHPGARFGSVNWTDASGNLWLFGGDGNASNVLYYNKAKLNDLWKYTPLTGLWTWISGDSTTNISNAGTSQPGVFGTKGVATASNKPSGRSGSAGWTDASGNLWLLGGVSDIKDASGVIEAYMNDLWKYAPSTGFWTWMNGDTWFFPNGVYGTQGVANAGNKPGGRRYAASWTDRAGDFYLFGGSRDTANNVVKTRTNNDLWKYSVSANMWTWVSGDNSINRPGIYGTQGIPSVNNKPGGRDGAMTWKDVSGNIWLFSGYGYPVNGYGYLNDMLKYSPSSSLPVLFSSFTTRKQQQSVQLSWSTAQEQNSMSFIIERSADGIFYTSIGTVAASGNTASSSRYVFTDITPLQGNNYYRLKEMDKDNEFMYSGIQKVFMGEETARFVILSNPVQHDVQISVQVPSAQKLALQVRDAGGHLLISKSYTAAKGSTLLQLAADRLARGTYYINIQSESLHSTKAFIKQ